MGSLDIEKDCFLSEDGETAQKVETNPRFQEIDVTSSLEGLQTEDQRLVLDTIAQIRKCGLESVLSLPQLVVCGDQSAGKSSVLEALTEIPFPRNDNLCTRFATEIILRRATANSLTIKVIPDNKRPSGEQEVINAFQESITNFDELPTLMGKAMDIMGIDSLLSPKAKPRAFAKDVLSIEIEGPARPQLTLVDLPGLIANETKGVTKADVELVTEITDHYISQPRTICLAVVAATNDYANQRILTKVREVDPDGERTLGIITKPDRLPSDSGSEKAFIALAQNEDIFFKLGWHVLKNRSFEEGQFSILERNASESSYFRRSNFKVLNEESVGIDFLRSRLSRLLFEHVKQELPKLREDLDSALSDSKSQLEMMGNRRAKPQECRAYLADLSLKYYELCKAAVDGHYEQDYFKLHTHEAFSIDSATMTRRLRALVQYKHTEFSNLLRKSGHKYHITRSDDAAPNAVTTKPASKAQEESPIKMSNEGAIEWVHEALIRTRGRELAGNFNPLLIGELFWEQSSRWRELATAHLEDVEAACSDFLHDLFQTACPKDIRTRLWSSLIQDALKRRSDAAVHELDLIIYDLESYPINYNHYYTDTVKKRRRERESKTLTTSVSDAIQNSNVPCGNCGVNVVSKTVDWRQVAERFSQHIDPDVEEHSCEDALDCLFAIYKVSQKTFVANVTTQVVERHIVRGLEKIFSPVVVNGLSDVEIAEMASEPASAKRQRDFLEDRITKLRHGHGILKGVMRSSAV